jgi:putative pyruvate formate lyase activating enzyme
MGRAVDTAEFVEICLALQKQGAENINIITGSHAAPAIVEGIRRSRDASLVIPCVWNSSAYEKTETVELLRNTVDIYVPDLKTLDENIAAAFFNAPDYPFYAEKAILKMIETAKNKNKVIIRHLVLPGFLESTKKVLEWFADAAAGKASLSLMTQYTPPPPQAGSHGKTSPSPDRFLNKKEYDTVLSWLSEFGIEDGFYQELENGGEWLPDFSRANPFASELSVPVWHWKQGFL